MKMKYENIIKQMTLAEKARMMSGKNTWETVDFEKYAGRPGFHPFSVLGAINPLCVRPGQV